MNVDALSFIEKYYGQGRPMNKLWERIDAEIGDSAFDPSAQEEILARTVMHPLAARYPGQSEYKQAFISGLMHRADTSGAPYSDTLCELSMLRPPGPDDDEFYSRFVFDEFTAAFKQSKTLSDIEAVVWPAGLVVGEWLASQRLDGLTVLELGSGTGVCSIIAAKAGATAIATDLALALSRIESNAEQNDVADRVQATALDWCVPREELDSLLATLPEPAIVLAADCVYAPDLCAPLATVLEMIAQRWSSRIIVASSKRREETQEMFAQELAARGFTVTALEKGKNAVILESYERDPVTLTELKL
ncbi:Nicotinamide N-methyltransferase-like [Carpediemonas membranifera]|uniref:Nicotinamide N-methyltransferase-like n=1 Tax=Carpediemonas membranifera TaxID=201153 RepID=A0A8J6DZI3_9EUKA|nr:Nicotinamide N-methyltransferase-like [Carpediemonas membranifera]|eukprot:KAG9390758.1 Nicotinamide N-methyltransferase-like [Carpediemonas membranifera]